MDKQDAKNLKELISKLTVAANKAMDEDRLFPKKDRNSLKNFHRPLQNMEQGLRNAPGLE